MEYSTIEKGLAEHERVLTYTVGVSMEPLLHNRRSTVVLEKPKVPLRQGDVVLYYQPEKGYVLHRIIKVLDDCYRIRGDNCIQSEAVPKERVIGVMVGFYENEKNSYTACTDKAYRAYMKILPWRYVYLWFRVILKRGINRASRVLQTGRK